MLIHLDLTEDIINDCLKLHYTEKHTAKKLAQKLILIPLALFVISGYLIYNELKSQEPGQNLYMAFLYIGFAVSYYFFMRYRTIKGGRQLLKTLGSNATFKIEVSDDKLVTTTKAGHFDTTWNSFIRALITNENILLYQANNSFSMFNYKFFKTGDFADFKLLVKEKVAQVTEL